MNRSEVLPSTTKQGIVRAGAGEHEAQFAMIDPVDKKPVTLDVEFAESRPFAFQRVIPVRVDQRSASSAIRVCIALRSLAES